MLSQPDGPFINLARLNVGKYAARPNIAKALFQYIFYHENLVREAMDLASQVLAALSACFTVLCKSEMTREGVNNDAKLNTVCWEQF